jgi:hypothetical protein
MDPPQPNEIIYNLTQCLEEEFPGKRNKMVIKRAIFMHLPMRSYQPYVDSCIYKPFYKNNNILEDEFLYLDFYEEILEEMRRYVKAWSKKND